MLSSTVGACHRKLKEAAQKEDREEVRRPASAWHGRQVRSSVTAAGKYQCSQFGLPANWPRHR